MFDLDNFNKQTNRMRRLAISQNLIWFIESTIIEALIGLIAAAIVCTLFKNVIAPNFESMKSYEGLITFKNCFYVLFGIRFVIRYLVNGFCGFVTTKKGE